MKKNFLLGSLILSMLFLAGCMNTQPKEVSEKANQADSIINNEEIMNGEKTTYIDVSLAEAKRMIDENPDLIIIDVSPKYNEGHLPGAINYYVGDGSLDEAIPSLDKMSTYLVYCHVDSASILGSEKLIEAGFENVYRLEGNYAAWLEAGYPIEK